VPTETPGVDAEATAAVLDASVAVRWLVDEIGTAEASALLARPIAWFAPRLIVTEVAAALRRKVAGGIIRSEVAVQALDALLQAVDDGTILLAEDERIVAGALALALSTGQKVPDCLYLALAEREGVGLATADLRLGRLAKDRNIQVILLPSA
jgi:predicted nucleic acid-binding protein